VRRNIASAKNWRHRQLMRRYLALSLALALAACATAPRQATVAPPTPVQPQQSEQNSLVGLTAQELVGRFGAPVLQIREGTSVKLQFRGSRCVLDAYLYSSGSAGTMRVTHIDTRLPNGAGTPQAACTAALGVPAS
jgi:outer membrane biogenesis lipoprotein LolB